MPEKPRRASLFVLFLTVFIDLLGFGIVIPLLPIYGRDFAGAFYKGDSGLVIGLLMSSFSAMQFLFSPMWGRLSDRIGRRPVLMIGLSGSVVFYGMFAVATVEKDIWLLFVSRIGAGIAGATIATAQAYIADATTIDKRHKGMALIGAAFGLGFTLGPLVGLLAVASGKGHPGPWAGIFAALLSLGALLVAMLALPESLDRSRPVTHRPWFGFHSLRDVRTPSVAMLLLSSFLCVFAFAALESTLSLVLKGTAEDGRTLPTPFNFSYTEICLTFAYIGVVLLVAQGVIVRRLAGRVSEGAMGVAGTIAQAGGLWLIVRSVQMASVTTESVTTVYLALTAGLLGDGGGANVVKEAVAREAVKVAHYRMDTLNLG
ncbi:MAG: MFS transporter [Planctomycetia bacterium]|nr:MFS transporter [Planctomycetia bacterium]